MQINAIDLFCGTKSFSKVAEAEGIRTFTSDVNKRFKPDYIANILRFDCCKVPFVPNIIWASPPCTYFSIASMWKHWDKKTYEPKSMYALAGIEIVKATLKVIEYFKKLNPELLVYIENPRGMLRHLQLLDHYKRHTVSYCQYGDTRMKPTDIWTNDLLWIPKPICNTSDKCHSSTTNDLSTASQRSVVPPGLCLEIVQSGKNNLLPGLASCPINVSAA